MQKHPTPKCVNYRILFWVSTVLCLILAVVLAIVLVPERMPSSPFSLSTTEGEIVEFLSDDLYFSLIVVRPEDGDDVTVKITPDTAIFDSARELVLWSGLSTGMKIRVHHTNMINAYSLYKDDWTPVPPILEECYELHIISS